MKPLRLGPHQLHRFYAGGEGIAELRGMPSDDDHAPEDWVGSTTTLWGEDHVGLSILDDGRLLRDAIAADPEAFLGAEHVARFGSDPALLVKLLDAGERLPVHAHPDRAFVGRHLDCPFGKTEAWVIVGTRTAESTVYLGFQRDVSAGELAGWVEAQDADALLAALHALSVQPGDAVLVPAGVPHAIGEGVLIVELQEPTDLSVLLEWEGYEVDGAQDGHLGLGFDVALGCVDRSGWGRHALEGLRRVQRAVAGRASLLPRESAPFFRAEHLQPEPGSQIVLEPAFSILVAVGGGGGIEPAIGGGLALHRGDTVLLPYGAGEVAVSGAVEVIRCLPPDPASNGAPAPEVPR